MRLFIAEKPSLARAIAAALPGPCERAGHHIRCANGDVVAWCAGHVLELAPPADYAAELKMWAFETLPIVPERWLHRVSCRELVGSLRRLVAKATRVVHAGDPDREGQLLVDEVLEYLGWRGATDRLLVTDLSHAAISSALTALELNEHFRPLYAAAVARQRADWLYGLNLSRLYTVRARLAGYNGVLSVGRVQTPVLGLIVRRDREIEKFVPKPFYVVEARLRTAEGDELKARWLVRKELEPFTDPEGRLLSREVADGIARKVSNQAAVVTRHEHKQEVEAPPLPYSLAALQVDAGRRLGLSAAKTLEIAQRLYEHELITYPRSDCSYLPEAHLGQATAVLDAIAIQAQWPAAVCRAADTARRSRAWNDAKITAHHAIIPTRRSAVARLNDAEQALYELVARRYIQQFMPPFEYLATKVELQVSGETFIARGRQVLVLGWRALELESAERDEAPDDPLYASLPPLHKRQELQCTKAEAVQKQTRPPKAFTDASLIEAMCGIAKYVSDPRARQVLKETDGLGTPATRAAIIETLIERSFIERRTKQIRSTPIGRAFIHALPAAATSPDMTAVWESALRRIQDGHLDLERFLGVVTKQLGELIDRGKTEGALHLSAAGDPTSRRRIQKTGRKRARKRTVTGRAEPRKSSP